MASVGKFGRCCCGSSRASVRAAVKYDGIRGPEEWMVGTWTYNGTSSTGTGPAGTETAAQVLQAMTEIIAVVNRAHYWEQRDLVQFAWDLDQGEHATQYRTATSAWGITTEWDEYTDGTGTHPAGTQVDDRDESLTMDWLATVKVARSLTWSSARTTSPTDGGDFNESGDYSYALNTDGTTTVSDTFTGPYPSFRMLANAPDTTGAVTEMVVTATGVSMNQTWTHAPYTDTSTFSMTWSNAFAPADVMDEALALLDEVDLVTAAAGAQFVSWVWAEGTAKAISTVTDPTYGSGNWPWAWRFWDKVADGSNYGYLKAHVAKVRVPVSAGEFGANPVLVRSEQAVFTENTLPPWNGSYPDGDPPAWTGTHEDISDWCEAGDLVLMTPTLVGEDLPGYGGYDFGKAEIATV